MAAILALPLIFLLIEAGSAGLNEVTSLIFRPLTWFLLWNTVRLTVVVTVACAAIGTAAAWCVERTDLPGRRAWAVLLVRPARDPGLRGRASAGTRCGPGRTASAARPS